MAHSDNLNSSIKLLALTRPADVLRPSLHPIQHLDDYDLALCSSLFELTEQLLSIGRDCPAVIIGRPAMLSCPSFLSLYKKLPRAQLIGWISESENPADKSFSMASEAGLIMVSNVKQLEQILVSLRQSLVRQTIRTAESERTSAHTISRDEYRLSNEELDALLGAG